MAKTASPALINFLGSYQPFLGADLYVFTLYAVPPGSAPQLFVTSLDRNVVYTGTVPGRADYGTNVYQSLGQNGSGLPAIQRSKLSMGIGLQPSKIDIELFAGPLVQIAAQPILLTMAQGLWANAGVFVRRAYLLPSDVPSSGALTNSLSNGGVWQSGFQYGPPTWNIGTTYSKGRIVYYSGQCYSALSNNTGNTPNTSPTFWLPVFVYFPAVLDALGHVQRVSVPGVSGGSTPSWNDSGGTTTDGGVTWQDQGANNWNTPIPTNLGGAGDGTLIWFAGNFGKINELGPLNCKFEARDLLWLLNRPFPKNLFGQCYHKLFDAGCGLNHASFTVADTVQTGSTAQVINTTQTQDQNLPSPPPALSLNYSTFGHSFVLPATTYFVQATYITQYGETLPGPVTSIAVPPNNVLTAVHPPSTSGATGWSIYVGTSAGDLQQQTQFGGFTQNYQESSDGIYLSGTFPPTQPTDGYFSLGVITVTYSTGTLVGQSVSGTIETSSWNGTYGQMFLRIPLPQVPAVGDVLAMTGGCNKTEQQCLSKWGYNPSSGLAPFPSFCPYVPTPESGS